jgi:hypothetical protein
MMKIHEIRSRVSTEDTGSSGSRETKKKFDSLGCCEMPQPQKKMRRRVEV